MGIYEHEELYRSRELMTRLEQFAVTVCGAGALGANITEGLARGGFRRLRVIDRDRVEERNLATQPFGRPDVGALKARALGNALYRAIGVEVEARPEELAHDTVRRLLRGSELIVDALDNSLARHVVKDACEEDGLPCLHVGLTAEYAEILWNEVYRVPSAAQDDACEYPLARNVVMMTVAVTCEVLVAFVATGERRSLTLTFKDLAIRPFVP